MIPRLVFFLVAAFWVAMNVLLWRAEYGSTSGEISVPPDLVWRKILTAPDVSSLAICQNGRRVGFCEFSTSVERAMATMEEAQPPPEGLDAKNGYKIHLDGNVSFGEFTNRVRFDGYLEFSSARCWRELYLKLSMRGTVVQIHSIAASQTVRFRISGKDVNFERVVPFAELQNPNAWLRQFGGRLGGELPGPLELPVLSSSPAASLRWQAHRGRMQIAHEPVSVYRLETQVFDRPIMIYTSSLGEILRVELPGGVMATLDTWTKP